MSRRLTMQECEIPFSQGLANGSITAGTRSLTHWLGTGDARLADLRFDEAPVFLELWDFILSEEERLRAARAAGQFIVGAMKDLGTVPVLVDALGKGARAFYPDGAWWLPCLQRRGGGQLEAADRLGIGEAFCPVRALLGCYAAGSDFPAPDLDICAVGATCDDFSAVAQRLAGMGRPILWWELPAFRAAEADEETVILSNGERAPASLARYIALELERLRQALSRAGGVAVDDDALAASIRHANRVRTLVRDIRALAFSALRAPVPALELLLVEILALHYCSDRGRCLSLLQRIHVTVAARVAAGDGLGEGKEVRVYWVNPVADLRVLNWAEDAGGRLCGTDFMTAQAMAPISETMPPLMALAQAALCDRMIGSSRRRAALAADEAKYWGAEAVVVARIPGASHCWNEAESLSRELSARGGLPLIEIEVPPLADVDSGQIRGRLEALMETAQERRRT